MNSNHYVTLGIPPTASLREVERAYRRLAFQYHPDVSAAPDAEKRMRAINVAYRTLRDPDERAAYDRQLALGAGSVTPGRANVYAPYGWQAAPAPVVETPAKGEPPVIMGIIVSACILFASLFTGLFALWTMPQIQANLNAMSSSQTAALAPSRPLTAVDTALSAPTVAPGRLDSPPLTVTATNYSNVAFATGIHRYGLDLTIVNSANQAFASSWHPRFLLYKGDQPLKWVDVVPQVQAKQRLLQPREQSVSSWYLVTNAPDEWVREVQFDALGWRWTWTFDHDFKTPQFTLQRSH